jgi:hypothetical protein
MKGWWMFVSALLVVIIAGTVILVVIPSPTANAPTNPSTSSGQATTSPLADTIVVDSPKQGAAVASLLTVTGKARGSYYFEASFPVKLKDANGNVIAQAPAQAQGDWMTSDFVPFTVTLTFTQPAPGTVGTLVLMNDNPSGDPAKQLELDIPVTF